MSIFIKKRFDKKRLSKMKNKKNYEKNGFRDSFSFECGSLISFKETIELFPVTVGLPQRARPALGGTSVLVIRILSNRVSYGDVGSDTGVITDIKVEVEVEVALGR